jgi:hypothetical protein
MKSKIIAISVFSALLLIFSSCSKSVDLTSGIMGMYQSSTDDLLISSASANTISIYFDHDLYIIHKATMSDASNFTFDETDSITNGTVRYIGGGWLRDNALTLNMSVTNNDSLSQSTIVVSFNGVKVP